MDNKNVSKVFLNKIEENYHNTLRTVPHYGAPLFAIGDINEGLAIVSENVDCSLARLNLIVASLDGFETYPHSISDIEVEHLNGIIAECSDGIESLLMVATNAVRYKRSFNRLD